MKVSKKKLHKLVSQHAKDYNLPVSKVRHYYYLSNGSRRDFYNALDAEVGLTERSPLHKFVNRVIFSKPTLLEIVTEYDSVQQFEEEYPNAYLHAKKKGWLKQLFPHLDRHKNKRKYDTDECIEVAKAHDSWSSFVVNQKEMYGALVDRGEINEVKIRAGFSKAIKKNKRYQSCLDNALKCESWNEFRFAYKKDYAFLLRNKLSLKARAEFNAIKSDK